MKKEGRAGGETDLRIQGNALSTEMMTATLVMMPVAITEGCCRAR